MKTYILEVDKSGKKYSVYYVCQTFEGALVELQHYIRCVVKPGEQYIARILSQKTGKCIKKFC